MHESLSRESEFGLTWNKDMYKLTEGVEKGQGSLAMARIKMGRPRGIERG